MSFKCWIKAKSHQRISSRNGNCWDQRPFYQSQNTPRPSFKMSSYRGSQYLEFLYIYQNLDIEIRSGQIRVFQPRLVRKESGFNSKPSGSFYFQIQPLYQNLVIRTLFYSSPRRCERLDQNHMFLTQHSKMMRISKCSLHTLKNLHFICQNTLHELFVLFFFSF